MSGVNGPGPQSARPFAWDRVGALYVNPDGTFEVSTVTIGPHTTSPGGSRATGR